MEKTEKMQIDKNTNPLCVSAVRLIEHKMVLESELELEFDGEEFELLMIDQIKLDPEILKWLDDNYPGGYTIDNGIVFEREEDRFMFEMKFF